MQIAFIGLGNMGTPMVRNLLKAGHTLRVFDLNVSAMQTLADVGAQTTSSPRAAVEGAECVFTMLPAASHVRSVMSSDEGILAGIGKNVPLIDSSTIDPASAQTFAELAARQGTPFADAPVSGGTGGAAAGTLTFMVGANRTLFERIQPILTGMGKNIVHCGEVGMGQVAKICNNLVLGISMTAVAEAMSLGTALGIDAKILASIINTSSGRCWSSDTYNPYPGILDGAPASRGYSGGFGTDLMLKDLGLAVDSARSVHQPVFMGALAAQLYQALSQRGDGRLDFSAIIKLYHDSSAV